MNFKDIFKALLDTAPYLLGVSTILVGMIIDEFEIQAKRAKKITAYIVALVITVFYSFVMASLPIWQIIILYLLVALGSTSLYTTLSNLLKKKTP